MWGVTSYFSEIRSLVEDIKKNKDGEFHNVKDFLETQSILATIYNGNKNDKYGKSQKNEPNQAQATSRMQTS